MPHENYFPFIAFAIALTAVGLLGGTRAARIALDRPNERSLHDTPVPRTGGLGLHLGILLLCPWIVPGIPGIVWIACLGLLLVSFIDDIRGLSVGVRLAAHVSAAGGFAAVVVHPVYGLFAACIMMLGVTWCINLYNFMDGSDGLAGGMALFGFGFYAVAAWHFGNTSFALVNVCIAATSAAFLVFNFHPARIFMGDVGAIPLGYLASTVGIYGCMQQNWPWWFPVIVFSPFIVDTSVTMVRRALRGARIWEAHREHCYQRLVRMGWGHRRTALAEYALMALCGFAALGSLDKPISTQAALLIAAVVLYAAIFLLVDSAWRKFQSATSHEA